MLAFIIVLFFILDVFFLVYVPKTKHVVENIEIIQTPIVESIKPVDPLKPEILEPDFVSVPKIREYPEDSVYNDVMNHCPSKPFGDSVGRSTNVHETVHGINSYLRNNFKKILQSTSIKSANGFYVLDGRGVILEEPNILKSRINQFVPENLRSYRYATYLAGQQEWEAYPLYIYDEWVAYVAGGKCNIDDVKTGKHDGEWSDGVSGCLDFSIYAVALSMAVKKHDPEYWETNKQFKIFTTWMLKEANKTYVVGHKMNEFKWIKQDLLLKELLLSSEAQSIRDFLKENFDGVWLDMEVNELEVMHYAPYQMKNIESSIDTIVK